MASAFNLLRDFIQKQMRMSHVYQPVMIARSNSASLHNSCGKQNRRGAAPTFHRTRVNDRIASIAR
jgi:hypothetical protein